MRFSCATVVATDAVADPACGDAFLETAGRAAETGRPLMRCNIHPSTAPETASKPSATQTGLVRFILLMVPYLLGYSSYGCPSPMRAVSPGESATWPHFCVAIVSPTVRFCRCSCFLPFYSLPTARRGGSPVSWVSLRPLRPLR